MKKVIGIYTFYLGANEPYWDESSSNMGGSETWTIEIAKQFQKKGYHTIVFGHPQVWHFATSGVEYVPREFLQSRCEYQHFDYFISSRTAYELTPEINCPNIYIMSHEAVINLANTYEDLKPNLVKKIGYLSEWHKQELKTFYGIDDSKFVKVSNGIDESLYADVENYEKKNMMVWSSCKERGLQYFIKAIYPCIKRMVPDFELAICAYNNDVPESYKILDGIHIYGKLSKKELADLQKQSKIWIYPNYGVDEETGFRCHETFCISAIENGFARNAIVCSNATGLSTTLEGYSGLLGTDMDLSIDTINLEKRNDLKNRIVEQAVNLFYDEESLYLLAQESYNICKQYTWEHAADEWINIFNES